MPNVIAAGCTRHIECKRRWSDYQISRTTAWWFGLSVSTADIESVETVVPGACMCVYLCDDLVFPTMSLLLQLHAESPTSLVCEAVRDPPAR